MTRLSKHNLPEKDIETIVNTIFNCMTEAMVRDDRVEIRGFGSFSVKTRQAREARNPKTGETVSVPKKRTPAWTTGKELADRVDAWSKKEPDQPATPFSVGD